MTDFNKMAEAAAAIGFAQGVLDALSWDCDVGDNHLDVIIKARNGLQAIDLMAIYEKKDTSSEA